MCGRYVLDDNPAVRLKARWAPSTYEFGPRFNLAPTQDAPVVRLAEDGDHWLIDTMQWGLVPFWADEPRMRQNLINARSETVREKPAFKNAIKRRRCLIPADGYYEWQDANGRKRPFFIHRRDGQPVGFAALAETWMGPNGEETDSVAIVTAPASRDLAALHHRVPVTIAPEEFERWLDSRAHDVDEIMPLSRGPASGEFAWHEISTRVNKVVNDDAQLLLPITEEERAEEEPKPAKKAAPRKVAEVPEDDGQGSLF